MPQLPQRRTLVDQISAYIEREIKRGAWRDWLPNERQLSSNLHVSRNTLRSALKRLRRDGVILSHHGSGNGIAKQFSVTKVEVGDRNIAILSPEPIERLRPNVALWIEHFRRLCASIGYQLHVVHGRQYYRVEPSRVLTRLLRQQSYACWVLTLSTEATQLWFAKNKIRCIVAGSVYAGTNLPYCAQDHRAACAHAAKILFASGHRKIAILLRRSGLAADLQSEQGFKEGAARNAKGTTAIVCHHEDSVAGISQQVRQLMRQIEPPTALLVTNAYYYLTVSSCLQQQGYRIPQDVSLISRNDDRFLDSVTPMPARYVFSPETMARGLLRLVKTILEDGQTPEDSVGLMPRFVAGRSLRKI